MEAYAELTHGPSNSPILSLPTELLTSIYCALPSLVDVLALAATCHRLHDNWLADASPIYQQVAPRSISCEQYARRLLADQKGAANAASILSPKDVLCIMRNSYVVEKAVFQYEIQINHKVKGRGRRPENYDENGRRKRHIRLTPTERPRFIRSYYQLWGMMKLSDPAERQSRLESMTLKQLYRLHETSQIPGSIGKEEELNPPPQIPIENPHSVLEMQSAMSKDRKALTQMIWKHIQDIYPSTHNDEEAPDLSCDGLEDGYFEFVVMWDHYQPILKEVVCGYSTKETPRMRRFNWELWDDSSDEEVWVYQP